MADFADQVISAESGGDANATNPNSSAAGAGQFVNGTWLDLVKQFRPDLAQGKSDSDILALRSDPNLSRQMVQAYAGQNAKALTDAGFSASPGNLYLAHFAGPQGAVSILKASADSPASAVMGPAATAANPFLKGMTVGQLRDWAAGKVGGSADTTASPLSIAPSSAPATATSKPPANTFGMLNSPSTFLNMGKQLAPGLLGGSPDFMPSPAPLPSSTPAAQAMRARLLASILSPQS